MPKKEVKLNKRTGLIQYGNMVTPIAGKAKYAFVTRPSTKFDPDGVYKIDFILPADEAQGLIDRHSKMMDDNKPYFIKAAKGKKNYNTNEIGSEVYDEEGNETGDFKYTFKRKAVIRSTKTGESWPQKVDIVDAKGQKFVGSGIGTGSLIKVVYEPDPYFVNNTAGIKLTLKAVQVLDLIEFDDDAASMFAEEDGYTSDSFAGDAPDDDSDDDEDY